MRGDQLLVAALAKSGVDTIFSLSGNQIMPVYDACLDHDVRIIHTRHESSAVFMAEAWAQLTGRCGIALVTAAPGFANALGAVYSSKVSHTPVLWLSGDSPMSLDGRGAFQEFPQTQAAAPFVKHTERVTEVANIRMAIERAISLAQQDPPGPVHLALPFDLLTDENARLDFAETQGHVEETPVTADVQSLSDALNVASKPLILTGPQLNRTRAGSLVADLEKVLGIPVICIESPRGLNDPALGSLPRVLKEADCVFYMGKEINFQTAFASEERMPSAQLLFTHPGAAAVGLARQELAGRLSVAQIADSSDVARGLISLAEKNGDKPARTLWFESVYEAISNRNLHSDSAIPKTVSPATKGIHPAILVKGVDQVLQSLADPVLVCDGGEFGQWAQGFARSSHRVINGASGAIGGSIPYAIGASIANPEAIVIAMLGDGTAGFYLAEFETAVRSGANPVYIIGNDARWNAEHQIQVREYGADRAHACELTVTADYAAVAAALGGVGLVVDNENELLDTLNEAVRMASQKRLPVCVNVTLDGLPAPQYQ